MTDQKDEQNSPILLKVLDAYLEALQGDGEVDDEAAARLDHLLRQGRVPKSVEIDEALFPKDRDEAES